MTTVFEGASFVMDTTAHRLALLRDGREAFPAMLAAIAGAQRTICLETYILRDDRIGRRFGAALEERARAGVEVNLLYDAWGSSVSSSFVRDLENAGVRTLEFHPIRISSEVHRMLASLSSRDHRKSLIVDSWLAFTGGINICDDYAPLEDGGKNWRDTHLGMLGPAAVELEYFFLRAWRRGGGKALDEIRYGGHDRRADPDVMIAVSDLRRQRVRIRDAYREAIDAATKRIFITNAYFVPTLRFIAALNRAARRGVDVRVMIAGTTDVTAVKLASRSIYGRLLEAGVRMFEWQGRVLHAKTAVIDGLWSTVGSSNLDHQSLRYNLEANAIVRGEGLAGALERMFEDDLIQCEEVEIERWRGRRPWERAVSWGAWLFRDWL